MIEIDLGTLEYYDEERNRFVYEEGGVARFEYSLRAVAEWESKWCKPFLSSELSYLEIRDFYKLMAIDTVDEKFLSHSVMKELSDYLMSTHTATKFYTPDSGQNGNMNGKSYTAEEIYAMMFLSGIPLEFENRNLNQLLVIMRIISKHNQPPKKMSKEEIYNQNRALNQARKAKYNTKG